MTTATAMPPDLDARIHALWDALADCEAAQPDAALDLLLTSLCALVGAQNATWIGAARLPEVAPDDPVQGWRPRFMHYLHPLAPIVEKSAEQRRMLEAGMVDITTVRNVALAGSFRCNRLVDLVGEDWFGSDYYRIFFQDTGRADAIWCGCPVNVDAEVYFGLFRDGRQQPFGIAERDAVAAALRGLKWFHRQALLSRGLLAASTPLTAIERKVLQGLLGSQSEKDIAAELKQSHNTTHTHVKTLYRKFGVGNRAALMALWLGKAR